MANIPTAQNNPGDTKVGGQIATYSSPAQGTAALYNDLTAYMTNSPKDSLYQFSQKYAPASDNNNPAQYAASLANQLGVSPDTAIGTLSPRIDDFASAISKNEGYQPPSQSSQYSGLGSFTPQPQTTQQPLAPGQSSQANQTTSPNTDQGFLGDLTSGNLLGAGENAGNFLFPAVEDIGNDISGTSKKTALQQAGDLGTSALTAIAVASLLPESVVGAGGAGLLAALTGTGAETALGRIGTQAAFGGAMGLSSSLGQGQTNPGQIAESTALGAGTGGIVSGVGELLNIAAQYLPARFAQGILKLNPETADYAVKQGLGAPAKMLDESDKSLSSLGNSLGSVLTHPQYAGVTATAQDIIPKIISDFPNAGLTPESVQAALEKVVPLQKTLINKLITGEGLNLEDLHTLNSALGENTYKTVFDDPVVKAGKDLANSFYHTASDFIQSKAPETTPLFNQLSKEYNLNGALQKFISRAGKKGPISMWDILTGLGTFSTLGPVGAAAAVGGEKLLRNPTVNMNAMGLLSKFGPQVAQSAATPVTGLLSRFAPQLTQL